MSLEALHPNTPSFAAWIAGYQNFYEPIVRAWFADRGLPSVSPQSVCGKDLIPSLTRLETQAETACRPPAYEWAVTELRRKSQGAKFRVQLDLLLQRADGLITGECKSWGGTGEAANWILVEHFFVKGPDSLFLFLSEIRGQPVVASYLVLWKRTADHDVIEARLSTIYGRPVQLFYLDEIFENMGPLARMAVTERLKMLDEACSIVRGRLTPSATCQLGGTSAVDMET